MSDTGELVHLWQAPFFDQAAARPSQARQAELEAEARARGFDEGKQEGMAAGMAQAKEIVVRMTEVADELAQPFRSLDAQVARELAGVAISLARQIIRREMSMDSSAVTGLVSEAIATLYKLDGEIVIFLNPVDAAHMRDLAGTPDMLEGKSWKIVEDSALSPGGCQVKTPTSFVDASLEKQMDVVFASLVEASQVMADS